MKNAIVKIILKRLKVTPLKAIVFLSVLSVSIYILYKIKQSSNYEHHKVKIYWFIPDGFRADRDQFNIYNWAKNGELPNFYRLMKRGAYGYSIPVFPGHTPVNFATLMTGVLPDQHGVLDGTVRVAGNPLNSPLVSGYSSFAKLVTPIWKELEEANYLVTLQSIPGSTPPDIYYGNIIRGRWGAWGVEFPSQVLRLDFNQYNKKFNSNALTSKPTLRKINLYGAIFWIKFQEPSQGEESSLKKIIIFDQNFKKLTSISEGQSSGWISIKLNYKFQSTYNYQNSKNSSLKTVFSNIPISTFIKFRAIEITSTGNIRLRAIYDSLNEYVTYPPDLSDRLHTYLGPMVDYVDTYPPQLIYNKNDRFAFLEEANESWRWHQSVVPFLINELKSDVVIHSIYTPNQMLTSRWWLPYIDKKSSRYLSINESKRAQLWNEVKAMYREADKLLGMILDNADENTYIVVSSDHGVIPLEKEVRLNNLFYKKGWLKFYYNPIKKTYDIDWKKTKVIFLQMSNIYINPKGLGGNYKISRTNEYFKLRAEVKSLIENLEEEKGKKIINYCITREESEKYHLLKDRVGDLILSSFEGYSIVEDVDANLNIFNSTNKGGYKQGVDPAKADGLLTPFLIAGPRIRKNYEIQESLNHTDQYAIISKITKIKSDIRKKMINREYLDIFQN